MAGDGGCGKMHAHRLTAHAGLAAKPGSRGPVRALLAPARRTHGPAGGNACLVQPSAIGGSAWQESKQASSERQPSEHLCFTSFAFFSNAFNS